MTPRPELSGLTALRLFAAGFVLLFHSRYFSEGGVLEVPIYGLFSSGWLGVDIFFVLSGFVISYVYSGTLNFPQYLLRRFARIYPAYLLSTLAALGLVAVLDRPSFATFDNFDILMNFVMLQGWYGDWRVSVNFVSWSVSAEWAAYIFFPALLWISRLLPTNWFGVMVPVVLFVVSAGLGWPGISGPVFKCVLEFTSGVMLFRLWVEKGDFGPALKPIALLSFLLMLVLPGWAGYYGYPLEESYLALFAIPIIAWAISWQPRNKFLLFGGRASYSIYLVHGVVYMLLRQLIELGHLDRSLGLPLFWMLSIGIAALTYTWIEKPARWSIVRWGSKLPFRTS